MLLFRMRFLSSGRQSSKEFTNILPAIWGVPQTSVAVLVSFFRIFMTRLR
jgi:hypothetical protein